MKNLTNFLKYQFHQISVGGKKIIYQKILNIFFLPLELILTILYLPIFIIIRLISKKILFRFGHLKTARIGHFAVDTHIYLQDKSLKKNCKDLIYIDYRWVCNYELLKLFKRYIKTYPKILIKPLINLNKIQILGNFKHNISFNDLSSSRDTRVLNDLKNDRDFCNFSSDQEKQGIEFLKEHNIDLKKDKFVCILSRDQEYMKKYDPIGNYDYHSYRNNEMKHLISASKFLSKEKYFVFRMGKHVGEKFDINDERIIDYANLKNRSEFLDIFLIKNCHFCISTDTGLYGLGVIFNKPILFFSIASLLALSYTNPKHIFLFKKYFSNKKKRFLTFTEIFENNLSCLDLTQQFEDNEITLIENNSEELEEAVKEMLLAINQNFKNLSKSNNEKFWKIFKKNVGSTKWKNWHTNPQNSHISETFLQKNAFFTE